MLTIYTLYIHNVRIERGVNMSQHSVDRLLLGKSGYLIGFAISFGLVALALVIQTQYDLEPCPLCITQRMFFMGLGVLFFVNAFIQHTGVLKKILTFLTVLTALGGSGWALRHWYLQANKESMISDCGVGFDYMFENFPLEKALTLIFKGTGDCATIDWTFLGLSLPQLALIAYIVLALYAIWLLKINAKQDAYFSSGL